MRQETEKCNYPSKITTNFLKEICRTCFKVSIAFNFKRTCTAMVSSNAN